MGWSAIINQWGSGYTARAQEHEANQRQDDLLNFMRYEQGDLAIEQMEDMLRLFEGPELARTVLEGLNPGAIISYLNRPRNKLQRAERDLFRDSRPLFDEVQQLLTGPIRDPLLDLLQTGFRTDISPIVEAEQHRLLTETAPALAERFAGALQGSGFANALSQSGEDLGIYLGERQAELDEAASGRRLQGLNMAPSLFTAPLDLQLGYAQAVGAAGDRWLARHPGARQLAALPGLVQAETAQGFFLPGFQGGGGDAGLGGLGSSGNWAALAAGIGKALPGLISAGRSLFGGPDSTNLSSLWTNDAWSSMGGGGSFGGADNVSNIWNVDSSGGVGAWAPSETSGWSFWG